MAAQLLCYRSATQQTSNDHISTGAIYHFGVLFFADQYTGMPSKGVPVRTVISRYYAILSKVTCSLLSVIACLPARCRACLSARCMDCSPCFLHSVSLCSLYNVSSARCIACPPARCIACPPARCITCPLLAV